jgi:L-fuconolactonase
VKIDSHQHFWKYDPDQYGWMDEGMAVLKRDHLPADLAAAQSGMGFDGSIAVQARQSLEESRWLLELADANPRIQGVVGWVDLQSDAVEDQLAELAAHPRLVGVRHVVQDEPDDQFMLRPSFIRGIAKLRAFGLTYDLLIYPRQLPAAIELVERFPEQAFVLDHVAKPRIKEGMIEPWATQIRALAAHPKVHCKISGMVTEADWANWRSEDFQPYLETALAAFGPERLMVGSDWPVCRLAGEYTPVMNLAIGFMETNAPNHLENFLGGNALAFYGVKA